MKVTQLVWVSQGSFETTYGLKSQSPRPKGSNLFFGEGRVFLFCFPFLKCKHVGFPFVFSFKTV